MSKQKNIISVTRWILWLWPFSRGKQTIAHHIFQSSLQNLHETVRLVQGGVSYDLNLYDRIQAIFYLTGLYESKTVAAACQILRIANPPAVVLDVGANVGLMSLQIKEKFPEAELHLFEADPEVFAYLKRNVELNLFSKIRLNNLAVSTRSNETMNFVKSTNPIESGWGRLENNTNKTTQSQRISVKTISIDQYLRDHAIARVDVLKIDVEGAEENVLQGCSESFQERKIKSIICEMHPTTLQDFGSSAQRIRELLQSFGFKEQQTVDLNILFQL